MMLLHTLELQYSENITFIHPERQKVLVAPPYRSFALLRWSVPESVVSPQYACGVIPDHLKSCLTKSFPGWVVLLLLISFNFTILLFNC